MRLVHAAVALVALTVGSLVLVSCSTTPTAPASSTPTTSDSSRPSATASGPYGTLTVAGRHGTTVGQLDPIVDVTAFNYLGGAIFDSLHYNDANNQLKPGIAERWEIAPDGMSHTYYIRKGVKFHDGSEVTGADVKFSIERHLAPDGTQVDAPAWRAAVSRVELKNDYTVVLHMKAPRFELMTGVSMEAITSVVPKRYIEDKGVEYFRRNPVGSGPWKFVKYEEGHLLELEAVESHWRVVPKFKSMKILSVPEEATKIAMLKTGELDMAAVAPDSVPGLKSAGLRVLSYDGGSQMYGSLLYDVEHPEKYAVGDVRVRKALQLAMDSKEIAGKILGGYGAPYEMLGANSKAYYFDPNALKPDLYDPEGAKKLLTEAGRPNGFNLRIYDVGGGGLLSTASMAVSGYWRKTGVNSEVVPYDWSTLFSKIVGRHPDTWDTFHVQLAEPAVGFEKMATLYHSQKGFAHNTKNPKMDELIDKVPQTVDPADKKRLALQAAVMAKNEYSMLSVVGVYLNLAVSQKVGDVARYFGRDVRNYMFESITHSK